MTGVEDFAQQQRINLLYDQKLELLKQQAKFEEFLTKQKKAQAEFQQKENLLRVDQSFEDRALGIERSVPINPFIQGADRVALERQRERVDLIKNSVVKRTGYAESAKTNCSNNADAKKAASEELAKLEEKFQRCWPTSMQHCKNPEFEQAQVAFQGFSSPLTV